MMQIRLMPPHKLRTLQMGLLTAATIAIGACSSDTTEPGDVGPPNPQNPTAPAPNDPPANGAANPGSSRSTLLGEVLVFGNENRSLYTFANDANGVSNCNGGCAADWPPIAADSEATIGDFSTIIRVDDSLQWAFKGSPLYHYAGDGAAGETSGEGLGNVWFVARPDPIRTFGTTLGNVLAGSGSVYNGSGDSSQRTDFDGRTLYTFANDAADVSNCNNGCAANWPPLYADQAARESSGYSIITRADGSIQWAFQSQPLYFYAGDPTAGDTNGEGVNGVWTVARPETSSPATSY